MASRFLGPRSYEERDREHFLGRAREAAELLAAVKRASLTTLLGLSGLGKTSLLRAGLFPRLRAARFLPVWLRLEIGDAAGVDLLQQVERRIAEAAAAPDAGVHAEPRGEGESLWEYLRRFPFWTGERDVVIPVLAFDQFEEVVSRHRARESVQRFLAQLSDLVEGRAPLALRLKPGWRAPAAGTLDPVKVVLSLREDRLADLEDLRVRMPSVAENRYRLGPMRGGAALDVVRTLGRGTPLEDPGRTEHVVRAASVATDDPQRRARAPLAELDVEPLILSLVCARLADGDLRATDLDAEERLVTAQGDRTPVPESEAAAQVAAPVLAQLVDLHLVRRSPWLGKPHLELVHDGLTEPVVQRRDRRRADEQAQAAQSARRAGEEAAARRRLLRARIVAAVALVVLVVGGTAAYFVHRASTDRLEAELRNARLTQERAELSQRSRAQVLAGHSPAFQETDPGFSLMLAREAVRVDRNVAEAVLQLSRALRVCPERCSWSVGSTDGVRMGFSPHVVDADGPEDADDALARPGRRAFLAAWPDGRIRVWRPGRPEPEVWRAEGARLVQAWFDRRSPGVFTAHEDGTAVSWSEEGRRIATTRPPSRTGRAVTLLGQEADGELLYACAEADRVELLHADGTLRGSLAWTDPVPRVSLSADGTKVLVLGTPSPKDSTVRWALLDPRGNELERGSPEDPRAAVPRGFAPSQALVLVDSGDADPAVAISSHWPVYRGAGTRDVALEGEVLHTLCVRGRDAWVERAELVAASGGACGGGAPARDSGPENWVSFPGTTLRGHAGPIVAAVLSPDFEEAVTAALDGTVRRWDLRPWGTLALGDGETGRVLRLSPDGTRLLSMGGAAYVHDLRTQVRSPVAVAIGQPLTGEFTPDSRSIATTHEDGTARVWSLETFEETRRFEPPEAADSLVAVLPLADGRAATVSRRRRLRVHGPAGDAVRDLQHVTGSSVLTLARDRAGTAFASYGTGYPALSEGLATERLDPKDEVVRIWSATGDRLWEERTEGRAVLSVQFRDDAKEVLIHIQGRLRRVDLGAGRSADALAEAPSPERSAGIVDATWVGDAAYAFERTTGGTGLSIRRLPRGHATPIVIRQSSAGSVLVDADDHGSQPCPPPRAKAEPTVPPELLAVTNDFWSRDTRMAKFNARNAGKVLVVAATARSCEPCTQFLNVTSARLSADLARLGIGCVLSADAPTDDLVWTALRTRLPEATTLPLVGFFTPDFTWLHGFSGARTEEQFRADIELARTRSLQPVATPTEPAAPAPPPVPAPLLEADAIAQVVVIDGGLALLDLRPGLGAFVDVREARILALRRPDGPDPCQRPEPGVFARASFLAGGRLFTIRGPVIEVMPVEPARLLRAADAWLRRPFSAADRELLDDDLLPKETR